MLNGGVQLRSFRVWLSSINNDSLKREIVALFLKKIAAIFNKNKGKGIIVGLTSNAAEIFLTSSGVDMSSRSLQRYTPEDNGGFLIKRLMGDSMYKISQEKMTDRKMNNLRKILYRI